MWLFLYAALWYDGWNVGITVEKSLVQLSAMSFLIGDSVAKQHMIMAKGQRCITQAIHHRLSSITTCMPWDETLCERKYTHYMLF